MMFVGGLNSTFKSYLLVSSLGEKETRKCRKYQNVLRIWNHGAHNKGREDSVESMEKDNDP